MIVIMISTQARLMLLIVTCTFLWSLESWIPLFRDRKDRFQHAIPNIALAILLVITNLSSPFVSAWIASTAIQHHIGLFFWLKSTTWVSIVVGIVCLDLSSYVAHVLLHKLSWGWRFHRVHHCDNEVNVTTATRQHPGETIWRISWQLLAIVIVGIPLWVVAVYLSFSALNAQLEHANIQVNPRLDWFIRLLLVTPDMHKPHHSRIQTETDSNYSNIFSFWDRLFGTYTPQINVQQIRYGLDGFDGGDQQTLAALLKLPFVKG
jgi:sterol desaturase/sphingolipid hydroxylase (fatty acid hydroxylase superfamily)